MSITLRDIKVVHEPDPYPDLSYLEDGEDRYRGEPAADIARYVREDQERIDAYNRGEWACIGVRAVATLEIRADDLTSNGGCILQIVESPGIWGVEDDAGAEYLDELATEQREIVAAMVREMGAPS